MTKHHEAGKGSKPRPIDDVKSYSENWDRIFGKNTNTNKEHPHCGTEKCCGECNDDDS